MIPKQKIFLLFLLIALIACKKNSAPTTSNPSTSVCLPQKSIKVYGGVTFSDTNSFFYNGNLLVKMKQRNLYDTIIYNTSGVLNTMSEFYSGYSFPSIVWDYSYLNGKLSKIRKVITSDTVNYQFNYIGNELSSIIATGDPNINDKISDMVWKNGNLSSAKYDPFGDGSVTISVVAEYDLKNNYQRFFPPTDVLSAIQWISSNNLISIQTVTTATVIGVLVPAGTKIIDNSYTYTSKNELATKVERPLSFSGTSSPNTYNYYYNCK